MEGNPVCLQVPWDTNPEFVKAWSEVWWEYLTTMAPLECDEVSPVA